MLPETLLCLLNVAFVFSQRLSLNSLSSFVPANASGPFTLPVSDNLTISVAICSGSSQSLFFVTNDSSISDPASQPSDPNVFQIQLNDGYGSWSGSTSKGGVLAIQNVGQTSFEVGVADNGPIHGRLSTLPFLGDSTSNQVLLFSPPFDPISQVQPSYPNYTLPSANLSLPEAPSNPPNFTLILAPTSVSLTSLPQTGCALKSASAQTGNILQQSLWLRDDEGWRTQWLVDTLTPSTNYTVYAIQDATKVSGPIHFITKSASFSCSLVHSLPYCPSISYAVPLAAPPPPLPAHDSTTLSSNLTAPLLEYMSNFTATLLTFACGRDVYSPLQSCADCQVAYRKWLCAISFTRCGEPASGLSSTPPSTSGAPFQTEAGQQPFSALSPQPTSSMPRNPNLPAFDSAYTALLPCIETCNAVDRACPHFLGFQCPVLQFNAAASYGVGYIDSGEEGEQGGGTTGSAQDRWGNIWCNGS